MTGSIESDRFFDTIIKKELDVLFWDDGARDEYKTLFTEIEKGFKIYGWNTCIVTDRKEALELALANKFDTVVLDLLENGEPVGLDMLRELKQKRPFLPIVIFTVAPEMKYVQSAMRGNVSYYLTKPIKSFHDVIRAIEVAIEKEKAKERLVRDRYFSSVGKLAASVAHFIKNSLWNISSRAEMILDETDEKDKSFELLKTIKRRCDDANKVVIDLLSFAKKGSPTETKEELDIIEIIRDVLKLLDRELEFCNIAKNLDVKTNNVKIMGNEFVLKEAFFNLFKNAIDAMPDGGNLSIEVHSAEKLIVIFISDNGVGMSEETLEHLFIPFFTTKIDSIGYGLYDTQRIIHEHGGNIRVESELKKGTKFIIEIPFENKNNDKESPRE